MFELASVCEDVANNIEDNLTGGDKLISLGNAENNSVTKTARFAIADGCRSVDANRRTWRRAIAGSTTIKRKPPLAVRTNGGFDERFTPELSDKLSESEQRMTARGSVPRFLGPLDVRFARGKADMAVTSADFRV